MSLQDLNILKPLGLELQLASPLFTQSSIGLQRKSAERMNSNRWPLKPPLLPGVSVNLLNRNLWKQFHEQETEMIITKSGRRMFPSVQINVSGLQKRESYYVLLEITPASHRRHKYCGYESGNKSGNMGGWSSAGPAEPQHPFDRRIYWHPDSPATGDHWMDNSINFNKLKLTNNINDNNNNVVLTSMHKYVPVIWIIRCSHVKSYNELFAYPAASFSFKEMEFIAVTAYQNEGITKLKIDNNPFAKGFRETGQSRFKRKYQQPSSSSSDEDDVCFSDSESNYVASVRDSVVSDLENLTRESNRLNAKRLKIENNAENNVRDIRPIAANRIAPIAENSRSPPTSDHNAVPFHRPWLDLSSHSPQPCSSLLRSLPSHSPLSCSSSARSSSSRSLPSHSPPMIPLPLSSIPSIPSLYHISPWHYFPYMNLPYNGTQNYTRFHNYQQQFSNFYRT